jgi:hypothetical protein
MEKCAHIWHYIINLIGREKEKRKITFRLTLPHHQRKSEKVRDGESEREKMAEIIVDGIIVGEWVMVIIGDDNGRMGRHSS